MMKRTTGVLAALLASTLFLSGCAGTGNDTGSGTDVFSGSSKAEATATATAEPTPTAIPGDENGDGKLSEFEKQVHSKKAPRDYTMPDGTVITIDPTQPLAVVVVDAIRGVTKPTINAATAVPRGNGEILHARTQEVRSALDAQNAATGKNLLAVFIVDSNDGQVWTAIPSGGGSTGIPALSDKTAFLAKAQSWADERDYELIVFD